MLKKKFLFSNNLLLDLSPVSKEKERCSRRWRRCSFFYPLLVFLSHDIFSPLPPTIIALSMLSPVLICFNFSREERIHHLSLPPDNSWQKRHKNVLHSCLEFLNFMGVMIVCSFMVITIQLSLLFQRILLSQDSFSKSCREEDKESTPLAEPFL